jgi:phage shock protein E
LCFKKATIRDAYGKNCSLSFAKKKTKMKKHTLFLGATLIALFALVIAAPAKDAKPKAYPLEVCIVAGKKLGSMGKPVTLVYKGQEVKFCCKGCIGKFKKNPEKYLVKLAAQPAKRLEHTKDSLEVVKARLAKGTAVLIDVREPFEWNDGHLKAATLMPLSDLREAKDDVDFAKKLVKKLPAKKIIYLHCRSGGRVLAATPILRAMKFDVRPLKAGYSTLVKAGFEKAK